MGEGCEGSEFWIPLWGRGQRRLGEPTGGGVEEVDKEASLVFFFPTELFILLSYCDL